MAGVKITVLKMDYHEELTVQYGKTGIKGPCVRYKTGQEIYCNKHYQPEEICDQAWKAMQHHVYAIYHEETLPIGGKGWMKIPGIAIVTCNNGLRPVTFKIERISPNDLALLKEEDKIKHSW